MNSDNKTWQEMVELSRHYVALGNTQQFIRCSDASSYPWDWAELDHETIGEEVDSETTNWSFDFVAKHPSGLTFMWSIFLVDTYDIDNSRFEAAIRRVFDLVPQKRLHGPMREVLLNWAEQFASRAKKLEEASHEKQSLSMMLRGLAMGPRRV